MQMRERVMVTESDCACMDMAKMVGVYAGGVSQE